MGFFFLSLYGVCLASIATEVVAQHCALYGRNAKLKAGVMTSLVFLWWCVVFGSLLARASSAVTAASDSQYSGLFLSPMHLAL